MIIIYSVCTFCTTVVTSPLHLTIGADDSIQGRIVQWLDSSFCTRDVEVTPSQGFISLYHFLQIKLEEQAKDSDMSACTLLKEKRGNK